jgi:hypothetical protein
MPTFQPKIVFYAVLNWKRVQFSESQQFWGIWKKMFVFKILLLRGHPHMYDVTIKIDFSTILNNSCQINRSQ